MNDYHNLLPSIVDTVNTSQVKLARLGVIGSTQRYSRTRFVPISYDSMSAWYFLNYSALVLLLVLLGDLVIWIR